MLPDGRSNEFHAENESEEMKRNGLLFTSHSGGDSSYYDKKRKAEAIAGRKLTCEEFERDYYQQGGVLP